MKILLLSNLISYTYNFRKELISALKENGNEVIVVADNDDNDKAEKLGCRLVDVPFDGKGTNISAELKLLKTYKRIVEEVKPDAVLSFTIKMNLYGGIVCRKKKLPYYPMITGLGELAKTGKLRKILTLMHRFVIPKAKCVFFQNESDMDFFRTNRIKFKRAVIVPGSGINLDEFIYSEYPKESPLTFAFIGRVTKAKGIEQYLDTAEVFRDRGYKFLVAGKCDAEYEKWLKRLENSKVVEYLGNLSDTKELFRKINCLVLPTYHPEGMSNVLLEAGATGRPCICTNRPGCSEIIEDGVNGFFCKAKDEEDLQKVIDKFSSLSFAERRLMGISARAKVERDFDRKIVVDAYLKELSL